MSCLVVDFLVLLVLHRFNFLAAVRAITFLPFIWFYRQRSPLSWHIAFFSDVIIQVGYAVGQLSGLIALPSDRLAAFFPYAAGLIALTYLWCVRERWFIFVRGDT